MMAVGSLVIMVLSFGPEGPGLIPDAAKDPPSTCSVCTRKICGSERPAVGHKQFTMDVVSGENFPPFHRHIVMDGAAIYHCKAEIGLLLLKNRPPYSGVMYLLCPKPYMGLGLPSGTRQLQQQLQAVISVHACIDVLLLKVEQTLFLLRFLSHEQSYHKLYSNQ